MAMRINTLVVCSALTLLVGVLPAEEVSKDFVPVNLGLFDPCQIADRSEDVCGFQLGVLWDRCQDMYGISIAGGGNVIHGRSVGVMAALGFNSVGPDSLGVVWAFGFNRCGGDFGGWSSAYGANICHGHFRGFQEAVSNYANSMHGVQFGFVNTAHDCHGLQVGLLNMTEDMSGFQVGVLNFIKNSPLPFFPIVNAHF